MASDVTDSAIEDVETTDAADQGVEETTEEEAEGTEQLGDAGKQALDRMKARFQSERDARKVLADELKSLRDAETDRNRTAEERSKEQERRNAELAATTKANQRLLKSEVRAASAGKLKNPADALAFLDLSALSITEDGDTDQDEIEAAIAKLLVARPYLAVDAGRSFVKADTTATQNKAAAGPPQLTRDDLEKMDASAIMKAQKNGQLDTLLNKGA